MIFICIVIVIAGMDLGIKYWIEKKRQFSEQSDLVNGLVRIEKSHNAGAFLNWMDRKPSFVLGVSGIVLGILLCAFAVVLPRKKEGLLKTGLSLLVGGAAGNFIDRLTRGYVVDYINFPKFKKIRKIDFNISDFAIFIGSIILLLISLFSKDSK